MTKTFRFDTVRGLLLASSSPIVASVVVPCCLIVQVLYTSYQVAPQHRHAAHAMGSSTYLT